MVRSGIVVQVDRASNIGIIEDARTKREFFFAISECCDDEMPPLYTMVTFIKDPDYKATDVAALIKRSFVMRKSS